MDRSVLSPGQVIAGKYRVERVLGRGGMGTIYEASHLGLGHKVALKVLRASEAASVEATERFVQEARIAASLPVDHIVRVTDVDRTEHGNPYIVMELLQGNDLAEEVARRGKLPVAEAVDLVLQACEGVAEAHSIGLVHRDLKPANLFLARRKGRAPVVKVLDFGLSKAPSAMRGAVRSMTSSNSTFGTPQYMSPEQVRSTKDVDARTDQHALGLVLFELVAGRPPFEAKNAVDMMVLVSTRDAPPLRSVADAPPGLEFAVARALAKDPNRRYPTVADFAAAIAPYGGGGAAVSAANAASALVSHTSNRPPPDLGARPAATPESVTGLTSSDDPLKKKRRGPSSTAVGAVVGVVALGGLAVAIFLGTRGDANAPASTVVAVASDPAPTTNAAPVASDTPAPAPAPAEASAAPDVAPAEPAASDAAPSTSASASAAPSARSTTTARTPSRNEGRVTPPSRKGHDAIEVFGGKRK